MGENESREKTNDTEDTSGIERVAAWNNYDVLWGYNHSLAHTRIMILAECGVNAFRVLLNEIGPNRTMELGREPNNIMGKGLAGMAMQRFGLQASEIEAVAVPLYWGHSGSSGGDIKPMEIRDGMAIVEHYRCPFAAFNAPPEICIVGSHYLAEGISQLVNPDYEFIFTHYLTNDDGRCRYVVKKKSKKFDPNNLGPLEKKVTLRMSQKERNYLALGIVWFELNVGINSCVSELGSQRTLELLAPLGRQTGQRLGAEFMGGAKNESDICIIRDKLDFLSSVLGQRGNSIITESGVERENIACPFMGGAPEVCMQFESVFCGVCEAINPEYEFEYDRMMSKGDHSCHWAVKKKSAENEAKSKESIQDDSFGY